MNESDISEDKINTDKVGKGRNSLLKLQNQNNMNKLAKDFIQCTRKIVNSDICILPEIVKINIDLKVQKINKELDKVDKELKKDKLRKDLSEQFRKLEEEFRRSIESRHKNSRNLLNINSNDEKEEVTAEQINKENRDKKREKELDEELYGKEKTKKIWPLKDMENDEN